jgi:hypothetical protein
LHDDAPADSGFDLTQAIFAFEINSLARHVAIQVRMIATGMAHGGPEMLLPISSVWRLP